MTEADLKKKIEQLEKELEITKAIADGRDPTSPARLGCPKCKTCGRDGSEAAVSREACLRVTLSAQRNRDEFAKQLKALISTKSQELPVPPTCFGDEEATEALRLWRPKEGGATYMVRVSTWENPYQWGMALADVGRYFGDCAEREGLTREDEDGTEEVSAALIIEVLLKGFHDELEDPTDTPRDWKSDA